jgi:SAM-dependent methyltransferase
MKPDALDWKALERLRATFLCGKAGECDYWQSESDLASYDRTFAQRIGWKWDYVLEELKHRGWSPPLGELLDWGCGSGVAGRAFLDHFGVGSVARLCLWDRSPLAVEYAQRKARERFPDLAVRGLREAEPSLNHDASRATLILSHVLTELNPAQADSLLTLARSAQAVLWVEPGTHEASRALIDAREQLRSGFRVVAPCTHPAACGMLANENARHWCHHFAPSPPEIFTDGEWARFAHLAGLDLRSLPLSFLVLDKRPLAPLPAGAVRVIGRPRVQKAQALIFACDSSGVRDRRLMKRKLPAEFARLKKGEVDSLQIWRLEGDEIVEAKHSASTS